MHGIPRALLEDIFRPEGSNIITEFLWTAALSIDSVHGQAYIMYGQYIIILYDKKAMSMNKISMGPMVQA